MTKKEYLKPATTMTDIGLDVQILAGSVKTTGLDGDDLQHDGSGDSWSGGMSRRHNNAWDDDEEEEDW
jgi:hypothetical protein